MPWLRWRLKKPKRSFENGVLRQDIGSLGEAVGLEWAGRWRKFREFHHFQFTGAPTFAELLGGKVPDQTAYDNNLASSL